VGGDGRDSSTWTIVLLWFSWLFGMAYYVYSMILAAEQYEPARWIAVGISFVLLGGATLVLRWKKKR